MNALQLIRWELYLNIKRGIARPSFVSESAYNSFHSWQNFPISKGTRLVSSLSCLSKLVEIVSFGLVLSQRIVAHTDTVQIMDRFCKILMKPWASFVQLIYCHYYQQFYPQEEKFQVIYNMKWKIFNAFSIIVSNDYYL